MGMRKFDTLVGPNIVMAYALDKIALSAVDN